MTTKADRKLDSGWLPTWGRRYRVPRKLKKAWRKRVMEKLTAMANGQRFRLHWQTGVGWCCTVRG